MNAIRFLTPSVRVPEILQRPLATLACLICLVCPASPVARAAIAPASRSESAPASASASTSEDDCIAASAAVPVVGVRTRHAPPKPIAANGGMLVVRIHVDGPGAVRALADYDLLEFRDADEGYVLALVDEAERAELQASGYRVEIDAARTEDVRRAPSVATGQRTIPGYACYRTVEETYVAAEAIVAARPGLATWTDVGDSWEKQQGLGGHDLRVLKLTQSAVPGPKPKLFATCGIHPREYATAELCLRFAEALVDGYGVDADATWILDHHEVHLMLQTNPDGRKQAETGLLWRKNTSTDYCGATSVDRGADLNRNFDFEWGCCGGSSGSECSETFRGGAPASEPEVQSVQSYLVAQFPDQRDTPLDAPAPDDATGVYLDMHSYGELVLWPWGFGGSSPNQSALRTLGRKLAYFNGYTPQQAIDLYPTDGTTNDFAYGELGVASFVFEIGTAFFQSCPNFEGTILPDNLDALIYAAKVARTPYLTPAGPDALDVRVEPLLDVAGSPRTIAATLDDGRYEQGNGVEPTQTIAAAEIWLDRPPWDPAGVAIAAIAADGAFDATTEEGTATLDTTGLPGGRHIVFVRGIDADGNAGAVSARFFWVDDGSGGTVQGLVTDADTSAPLAATVSVPALGTQTVSDPATGVYVLALPAGEWTLSIEAAGYIGASPMPIEVTGGATVQLDAQLAPYPSILVVDDDDNDPDIGPSVTAVLDALGEDYFVWDTGNSDDEPTAELLANFDAAIWSTGEEYGGAAGPGSAGEAALAQWLDEGACLLVAAQDYYYDRGLTPFMQDYLGVASAVSDVAQTTVTGQGTVFDGLGPYTLSFPYSNWSDTITPSASAEVAFEGTSGSAAVALDGGHFRSSFWSFGLETLPTPADRETALSTFLGWCDALAVADGDHDGVANAADCSPADPGVWALPAPADGLTVARDAAGTLSWSATPSPGATAVTYDVLRSAAPHDFSTATCVATALPGTAADDATLPAPGELFAYLVRASNACGGSLGTSDLGVPRSATTCP